MKHLVAGLFLVILAGCRAAGVSEGILSAPVEQPPASVSEKEIGVQLVAVPCDGTLRVSRVPRILEPLAGIVSPGNEIILRWEPPAPNLPERFVAMVDDGPLVALFPGDSQIPLASLIPPPRVLGEGDHRVVLCALRDERLGRTETGFPACHVSYFSFQRMEGLKPSGIVVISPHGTYSGASRASRIPLEVFLTGQNEAVQQYVSIRIKGFGIPTSIHKATLGQSYKLENLASGDYKLYIQLHGSDGHPVDGRWNTLERLITINADVPDEPSMNVAGMVDNSDR